MNKYPYDANFFDNINTEQKAYILGFFYADGYNYESKKAISIRIIDYDIICQIRDVMSPTRPFHIIEAHLNKNNHNQSKTYVFTIYGTHISEMLAKQGCPQTKSKTLMMPPENIVPKHLLHHFVRGYFDGDGCVSYAKKSERVAIDIICNRVFAEQLASVLPCESRLRNRTTTEMTDVRIGKQADIQMFARWLYRDATIFLKRKRDKLAVYIDTCENFKSKQGYSGDKEIYSFENAMNKFIGTRIELRKLFPELLAPGVCRIINGSEYKGWRLT